MMATDGIDATGAQDMSPDWVDALLRDGREGYIDDAGFTARVMADLPGAAPVPAWRKPAVAVLWGLAVVFAGLALPGVLHDITREAYRLYTAQPLTLPLVITAIAGIGIAMWTAAAYTLRVR